jgi:S-adenosylmethionine:tRNA ribosyltransferase-isomerase
MSKYSLSDFDYTLPDELIATHPASPRDSSRLLVLDKETGKTEHRLFSDIVEYLNEGDVLVLNDSKVIPARLFGFKEDSGGKVEVLLHKKVSSNEWECLLGGRVHERLRLSFQVSGKGFLKAGSKGKDILSADILKNNNDGTWLVKFSLSGAKFFKAVERIGQMPLPPYIVAQIKGKEGRRKDKSSYQTVFADDKKAGSVAAPTAGLHFTPRLLSKIKKKGVKISKITLYVGMGTFAPVKTEDISKHKMHAEWVEVGKSAIGNLQSAIRERRRVIAVGTTSCRSLEACFSNLPAKGRDFKAWVDIFITPGYKFKVVDALITNFHQPKSTLMMLVSALAGKKNIDQAYREAIKKKYRFYSYGDAMFIK